LDYYRRIIPAAPDFLLRNGWLLLEVGSGEAPDVLEIFSTTGMFQELFSACDAGGVERVVGGRKK
jgi:release factor glutamine methyltransferase